jgi:hypothetical protein
MKYRLLNNEELLPLQEEFLKYLLVAGISPDAWNQLKKQNTDTCHNHLVTFSDLVFEKIIQDVQFVEVFHNDRLELYQFYKESAFLLAIENKELHSFNFLKDELASLDFSKLNIFHGKKVYTKERNFEIFEILQQKNSHISQGELFKKVSLLLGNLI